MFNPNMFNQMAGQMPNLPSTADLWKDEKSKYRHWMVLFLIGICLVLALMITGMVMTIVDKTSIVDSLVNTVKTGSDFKIINQDGTVSTTSWIFYGKQMTEANLYDFFNHSFTSSFIISPSLNIGFIGIGVLLFMASLFESYKVKSFAKLSSWPTFVIGFSAFMAFFSLISFTWNHNDAFVSSGAIIIFVANISTLVVYFGGGMQVSRIRKQFVMSDRIEKMKANPQFQAAANQFGQMMGGVNPNANVNNGAYAPQNMNPTGAPQQPAPVQGVTPAAATAPIAPAQPTERQKLEAMSHDDLKKLAKKLSISGSKDMKKEELVDAILRIHDAK